MQHVCLSTCTIQQDIISMGSEVFVFYHKFLFDMLDLQNFKKILWNWNDQNAWIVFIDNIICYHWWTCFSTESAFLWVPHVLLFFFQNHNFVWSLPRNIGHRLSKCQELNKLYIFTYLCHIILVGNYKRQKTEKMENDGFTVSWYFCFHLTDYFRNNRV